MNTDILSKIADLLKVSVEKVIELYPQLRTEAVFYSLTQNILGGLLGLATIIIFFMFIDFMNYSMGSSWDESVKKDAGKRLKVLTKFLIFIGVLTLIILVVSPFLYPDIVFFQQFIK